MVIAAPISPLAPHPLLVFLVGLVVLLLLAKLLGRLAERLGMPAIVGELITGLLIGPSLLGHFAPQISGWLLPAVPEQIHLLDAVGQLGVLLLVGITGTHLDLGMLRRQGGTAALVSLCGLIIPLGLGILLGANLPASVTKGGWVFALFLGVAMCVSAIPVIAKTLSDMKLLHRNIGQLTLAAGMIDDAVGWLLLSVVAAAATVGVSMGNVTLSVVYLVGFVILAATLGRVLVRKVMTAASKSEESGPAVAAAVIIVLLGAVTTHSLGMEPVFGAFVAGILITTSPAAQVRLAPLRTVVLSVLAPLFLATAGLRMDLTALFDPTIALTGLAVLAVAIIGKFAGAYLGARLSKLSPWEGIALGAGMNARGVIEVIVALTGLRLGVLNTATYTIIVLVAIVTSLMAPPLLRLSMKRVAHTEDERLRKIDHDTWHGVRGGRTESATDGPDLVAHQAAA
ncbi:Kef-type K+ transport system membrane component KefB [Allocatelliglobosispora scoriae]|uniref:Kef-type K+ transport system membrane component KefB n=1 Tax=Allocatelliglobosispora scoriae TaxID=643052 RepID=A0A841BTD1_9ACTN|nr:cation:proton antiporter [Allocatelliglobosispora scoriae]MBB5870002.1 Kef-type K+ transport system membrane component KefB [Allocatelliglobosispora scoriae]